MAASQEPENRHEMWPLSWRIHHALLIDTCLMPSVAPESENTSATGNQNLSLRLIGHRAILLG